MRLVVGALALTLFAAAVQAEDAPSAEPARVTEAAPGKIPLRVVRVMPESRQALLFDRARSTHVLAEVGGTVAGYTVEAIEGDEVRLRSGDTHVVLVAPARARGGRHHAAEPGAPVRSADVKAADTAGAAVPEDPYGDGVRSVRAPAGGAAGAAGDAGAAVPSDPYGVRSVRAPDGGDGGDAGAAAPSDPYGEPDGPRSIAPGEGGVRVVRAPDGTAAPAAQGPRDPYGEPDGAAAPVIAPGEGGIRVALAPGAPAHRSTAQMPADPYASASDAPTSAPLPPHDGVRVVRAPGAAPSDGRKPDRGAFGERATADAPSGDSAPAAGGPTSGSSTNAPATGAPTSGSSTNAPATSVPPANAPAAPARASGDGLVLSRAELAHALGNFAALAAGVRGSFSAQGLVVAEVSEGTIFHRAGLRAGDVVASVDGAPLRSLDDAANLYARAARAKVITAQIVRAGKPIALQVTIQ